MQVHGCDRQREDETVCRRMVLKVKVHRARGSRVNRPHLQHTCIAGFGTRSQRAVWKGYRPISNGCSAGANYVTDSSQVFVFVRWADSGGAWCCIPHFNNSLLPFLPPTDLPAPFNPKHHLCLSAQVIPEATTTGCRANPITTTTRTIGSAACAAETGRWTAIPIETHIIA